MNFPAQLKREFAAAGGTEVVAMARALYDIEGNLGETYLVTDGRKLALYSRRVGGSFVARILELTDISQVEVGNDGPFLHLRLQPSLGQPVVPLKFSSWDRPQLDQIVALWTTATGRNPGGADGTVDKTAPPEPALTPLVAFCASLHAMISIDGHVDQGESLVLSRLVHEAQTVAQGAEYFSRHGLDPLLSWLGSGLSSDQKRCLFANMLAAGLVDGLWRGSEQELCEQFRTALDISESDGRVFTDVLMVQLGVGVLAQEESTPADLADLTPLSGFCASLHAMTQCDNNVAVEELDYLTRALQDPNVVADGAQYLVEHGVDALLHQLTGRLGPVQKRCLIANLLGIAMADGLLRSHEQELLARFQEALQFPAEDYTKMQNVLMTKYNLQVFA